MIKNDEKETDDAVDEAKTAQTTQTEEADDAIDAEQELLTDEDASEEDELSELQDRLQRTLAELENTRRRFDREKQESIKYAIAGFAGDILNLADNLDRALKSVPEEGKEGAFGNFVEGVSLSAKELVSIFERNQIKKIEPALGASFSPSQHQAVSEMPSDAYAKGSIAQLLQPGYALHDRLIRPAMVMVSSGAAKKD